MRNATNCAGAVLCAASRLPGLAMAAALGLAVATTAQADIIHDESINGDLSGDAMNPTEFTLSEGANSVVAMSVSGDLEYIALTVPTGLQLQQVVLVSYVGVDDIAFIAVQEGDSFTEPPVGADPANMLGWSHFGPGEGNVGNNILPAIGMGPGAMGFTPPLMEGTYTFWIQQTGDKEATYQFDFLVVPAPAAAPLLGLVALIGPRRRRQLL